MFRRALVRLDGSELAEGILLYVSQLMKGLDGSIVLLSVIDPDVVELPKRLRQVPSVTHIQYVAGGGTGFTGVVITPTEESMEHGRIHPHDTGDPHITQIFDRLLEGAKRRLNETKDELSKQGVRTESVVAFGRPAETIARVAKEKACDIIAMSTHGRDALARGVLGSVTDKITHMPHHSTLTITPKRAKQYWEEGEAIDSIIVPLDGSSLAESVLPYAEFLAKQMSLEILLVRVLNFGSMYAPGFYPYFGANELEAEIEAEAMDYLGTVSEGLKAKGLKVGSRLLKGHPAIAILDLARKTPRDIIVITSHGRSGIRRWAIGSVADTLIRASGDPVIVISSDSPS